MGLAIDDPVWDHSVFSKNRDRLLDNDVVERFFSEIMKAAEAKGWLSKEHFSVDGTLIQADRKSTRLNSSHIQKSRMPSSA